MRDHLFELLERHGLDLGAAAREAELTVEELRQLVREQARPRYEERVRAFYGPRLDAGAVERVAEQLLGLELEAAQAPRPLRQRG